MSLSAEVDRLVAIGFQWAIKDPRYVPWEALEAELLAFIVSVRPRLDLYPGLWLSNASSLSFSLSHHLKHGHAGAN
jgi:hypothetical protein